MFVLGVTGPIGSGKSTLMRLLRRSGYVVLSADAIFHHVLLHNVELHHVLRRFDVAPTRQALWTWLERDSRHWSLWQALTGGLIAQELHRRLLMLQRFHITAVAIEIPLLFELGLGVLVHKVIGAQSSPQQQALRLKRRGLPQHRATSIKSRALPWTISKKLVDESVLTKGMRAKTGLLLAQTTCNRRAASVSKGR